MASAPLINRSPRVLAAIFTAVIALFAIGAANASAKDKGWTTSGPLGNVVLQVHNGLIAPDDSSGEQFQISVINYNSVAVNGKISLYATNKKGKAIGKPLAFGGFQLPTNGPSTAILLPSEKLEKIWKDKSVKSIPVRAKVALWTNGYTSVGKAEGRYTIVRKLKGAKGAANTLPTGVNSSLTVKEGATLSGALLKNVTDPDGDHLYLRVTQRPAHLKTFTIGADGLFTYVGAANFSGSDSFVYDIFDGTGYSAPVTVSITVTPKAPTIAAIADQKVNGGDQAGAQTIATKSFVSSSLTVTYSLTGTPPSGATINSSTGVITVPAGTVTAGSYSVTLKAENAAGASTKAFKIIVKPGKIGSLTAASWVQSAPITTYATAGGFTAASGATYSATDLPAGVSINTSTGELTGTPTAAGSGTATITITDANGTATQSLAWTVSPPV